MKNVAILIHEDAILSSVSAPLDILTRTNQLLLRAGHPAPFNVELVSENQKSVALSAPAWFQCQRTLADIAQPDLIIVPAFIGDPDPVLQKNAVSVKWIAESYATGVEVASLCVGAYFLAQAGVLSGRACTSHWAVINDLRWRYPDIQLQPDAVITDQDGIYTGGGAFSSLNLVLYLVEKFCGREVGIQVGRNFSINPDQISQAHFAVFYGQRNHGDADILRAQAFIEAHFREDLSIEQIANTVNMSRRNFIRRFKSATHNTPQEYLQRVKVEAAKKALERNSQSVSALMYDVGYNDSKTFRDIFKRITGLTPQAYRAKYCRETA